MNILKSKRAFSHIIREGKALVYTQQKTETSDMGPVFYNPVQEFNRDMTIAVIKEFYKDLD